MYFSIFTMGNNTYIDAMKWQHVLKITAACVSVLYKKCNTLIIE